MKEKLKCGLCDVEIVESKYKYAPVCKKCYEQLEWQRWKR
jgi:formylmethanofuran dehydrogenase subunit E